MENQLLTLANAEEEIRNEEMESLEAYRKGAAEAPDLVRFGYAIKADEADEMTFVASEESPDRYEDTISVRGWDLKGFKANPVFLFAHDNHIPPVGRVSQIAKEGTQLIAKVQWDMEDQLGALLQHKYANKFMRAVSVGFRPTEFKFQENGNGIDFIKQELLELSAVPVPAHPKALKKAMGGPDGDSIVTTYNLKEITNTAMTEGELRELLAEFTKEQGGKFDDILERLIAVETLLEVTSSADDEPPKEVEELPADLVEEMKELFASVASKE